MAICMVFKHVIGAGQLHAVGEVSLLAGKSSVFVSSFDDEGF